MDHVFFPRRALLGAAGLAIVVAATLFAFAADQLQTPAVAREMAKTGSSEARRMTNKMIEDGNFAEAYEILRARLFDKGTEAKGLANDFENATHCLHKLNRSSEVMLFVEEVVAAHSKNWRICSETAFSYSMMEHTGVIVGGEYVRGRHRGGGGRRVQSEERDRVRALQLFAQARHNAPKKGFQAHVYYLRWAGALLAGRQGKDAWRLQVLTDTSELPDYDEAPARFDRHYGRGTVRGAPVDENGDPIFYDLPERYEDAKNDGERWRWVLTASMELGLGSASEDTAMTYADFLHSQFGVQTMSQYGSFWRREPADDPNTEDGTWSLHTLGENETMARLATGVGRFDLPEGQRFIEMYREVAESKQQSRDGRERPGIHSERAWVKLGEIFENRRQYDEAARCWREVIARAAARNIEKDVARYTARLNQVIGAWGQFESVSTQPAGQGATVDYRFRNGDLVDFTAREINVEELLADVKQHIESKPKRVDWNQINIQNIGHRLVRENQSKYIGAKVADWSLDLDPRPGHFDRRITVSTPLQKAGAYYVTAKMKGGNTTRIVLWLSDTAIVKKPVQGGSLLYVADARTGKPIEKANLEFFGYYQKHLGRNEYQMFTRNFAEFTDADGMVIVPVKDDESNRYQYMITARTDDGRLAYLGWSRVWNGNYYDREYNQTKAYCITDRPVYRPGQSVKFKAWVRAAKYDLGDVSQFANRQFNVRIHNPKGDLLIDRQHSTDEFGGLTGEIELPKDATLGSYRFNINGINGGVSFRVEEYKKPEFEVKVEAPTEPVMLGETIPVRIKANYYFGAPVANGTVKYKVLRSAHTARWYPPGRWDWLYGPGYWWFAYDYEWFPGWRRWGCMRPSPWWIHRSSDPPEVVMENDVEIGEDGVIEIKIDTSLAKAIHGDQDHRYEITAEVTDESRRTIVGKGTVLVAREPFKVTAWVDRGHYRVGDTVTASFSARTLDGKPVAGKGKLDLLKITYEKDENGQLQPVETSVRKWRIDPDTAGRAEQQLKASEPGQYRLAYTLTDTKKHTIEGGYLFTVRGAGFDGSDFRFNDLELIADKKEYKPGDTAEIMINTNRSDSTVLLFVRPANGVYLKPKIVHLRGKSVVETVGIIQKDMPNAFIEAITIADGRVHTQARELIVPPSGREINVSVDPSKKEYKPGEDATVGLRLTTPDGEPFVGSMVVTMYDKALEYISGGSNVGSIREFFWKWRRRHNASTETNLGRRFGQLLKSGEQAMRDLGVFGHSVAAELESYDSSGGGQSRMRGGAGMLSLGRGGGMPMPSAAPMRMRAMSKSAPMMEAEADFGMVAADGAPAGPGGGGAADVEPTVRTNFADSAYWNAAITTNKRGRAKVTLTMPENLTGWHLRAWGLGHGTKVGEGTADVVTKKNLLLRMQAPRFFVEKDEVVLSANIHNYLDTKKRVTAILELDDDACLEPIDERSVVASQKGNRNHRKQTITIAAGGEERVDWRVKVVKEGEAVVRMKALTDEESDAMEMKFPAYVHGADKMVAVSGYIKPDADKGVFTIDVPAERRINSARFEVRYSPTLAGAMVDALPYLADYPYGCTEQTLSRFLPTVITQKVLREMGVDLASIRDKTSNLNAQEIGEDTERAKQWRRYKNPDGSWKNPVFDEAEVTRMVKDGVEALTKMQLSDGGWGWFSGYGEHSYPHTTAYVVHGLQIAMENDIAIVPGVLNRGVAWLEGYQQRELAKIKNWGKDNKRPKKRYADNLDAFVYMVLADADKQDAEMRKFLYRDRVQLAVYAKSMFGIALHKQGHAAERDMIIKNIEQFLVRDDENQTAYLNLGNSGYWWNWYGSEYEAHAYYLKLLSRTGQADDWRAPYLVKYLLNNRKHATYWKSTRDTAVCVEAFADYLRASGEDKPDLDIEILVDGKLWKTAHVDATNLFTFDNKLEIVGDAVESGKHEVEIRKKGTGPLYFNAYLSYFSLEDFIERAGLEVKVNREVYKLVRVDKEIKVAGSRGQAVDQKVEKYRRERLANDDTLKSGDLIEIELTIESKNDYEYLVFEDMKAAGFEPVDVRSGYTGNDMGAYVEFRDNRVAFFVRRLARGKHSVSYKLRAEIPGRFSALPTQGYAMYAPELRGNSEEIRLNITD